MGRDQDHGPAVVDQPPRELEAALVPEEDVDEDDVRIEALDLAKRVGGRRSDSGDA
jgi:hypothetical protein